MKLNPIKLDNFGDRVKSINLQKFQSLSQNSKLKSVSTTSLGSESSPDVIQRTRELSISRPNWNLCVGDLNYKTGFSLEFLSAQTSAAFANNKIVTSLYSFRAIACFLFVYLCYLDSYVIRDLSRRLYGPGLDPVFEPQSIFSIRTWTDFIFDNFSSICLLGASLIGTFRRDLNTAKKQTIMVSFLSCLTLFQYSVAIKATVQLVFVFNCERALTGVQNDKWLMLSHAINLVFGKCLTVNSDVFRFAGLTIVAGVHQENSNRGHRSTLLVSGSDLPRPRAVLGPLAAIRLSPSGPICLHQGDITLHRCNWLRLWLLREGL